MAHILSFAAAALLGAVLVQRQETLFWTIPTLVAALIWLLQMRRANNAKGLLTICISIGCGALIAYGSMTLDVAHSIYPVDETAHGTVLS